MWPALDPDFKPAVNDTGFIQWMRQGLTALCLLVDNQEFIEFKTMSGKYGLAQQDFYRFLQLRHYFDKNIKVPMPRNVSSITQMFIRVYNTTFYRKIIGELYKYITQPTQQITYR